MHDDLVFVSQVGRQEPSDDFAAVERMNGDEVENGERSVDSDNGGD